MNDLIISITGHRPNKLGHEYDGVGPYSDYIRKTLQLLIDEYKPTKLITGMALGVDLIWAELSIENNIPFIATIPCINQTYKWSEAQKKRYLNILRNPLCKIHMVSDKEYTPYCMQQRNEWMVNNSDLLIAVWDGTPGGTKNCHDYAFKLGKPIRRIRPQKLVY